jgi:TPR repeat protein
MSEIAMFHQPSQVMTITATQARMRSNMPSGVCMEVSMKRRWVIVGISSMALICAGILVRTERKNRQLAKRAAAYRILAEQGDAKSQLALGGMYYYGKGVPKDYVEAAHWYLKSAEQGNVNAQYSIASMYYGGKGVPQDNSEGARWCRRAAEQGDAPSEYGLGIIYSRGQGVPQDYAEAVR